MTDHTSPFSILNSDGQQGVQELEGQTPTEQIEFLLSKHQYLLFMKGSKSFPQCGFSANTVAILQNIGLKFETFDILSNQEIRQTLKEFSGWPTYPQLYAKGKLIGGNDVITELFHSKQLKDELGMEEASS